MTECYECDQILSENHGGVKCIWKRYRKYIIGFVAGCIVVYLGVKVGGQHK